MSIKVGVSELVAEANKHITTLTLDDAAALLTNPDYLFVDLRDVREIEREGTIPNAFNANRGMIEFWVDPKSPYFKKEFEQAKNCIFFCQSGWRSALATKAVQDMGMTNVAHIDGGFRGWCAADKPTQDYAENRAARKAMKAANTVAT